MDADLFHMESETSTNSWTNIRNEIQIIVDIQILEFLAIISEKFDIDRDQLIEIYNQSKQNICASDTEKKRRGRKKKSKEIDIQTEPYTYKNITYLVDDKHHVYTYDINKPVLVGQKLVNGTIKFEPGYHPRNV